MNNDHQMQLNLYSGSITGRLVYPRTDYGEFVQKLATSTVHDDQVPPVVLKSLIYNALRGSDVLDEARKSLFYGKPSHSVSAHRWLLGATEDEYPIETMDLVHAALGLRNEADEILRLLLKVLSGERVTHPELIDEAGDVTWFLQLLANYLGVNLENFVTANMAKLNSRYPNGFDPVRAMNPDKVQEMKTMANTDTTSPMTT